MSKCKFSSQLHYGSVVGLIVAAVGILNHQIVP